MAEGLHLLTKKEIGTTKTVEKYRVMDYDQYNTGLASLRGDTALQDSFPNTYSRLLIAIEAQVALSGDIGGIVNLIIGQRSKFPSQLEKSFCSHKHPKNNPLSGSDTKGPIFSMNSPQRNIISGASGPDICRM